MYQLSQSTAQRGSAFGHSKTQVAIALQPESALHRFAVEQQCSARHDAQPGNFLAGMSAALHAGACESAVPQAIRKYGTRATAAASWNQDEGRRRSVTGMLISAKVSIRGTTTVQGRRLTVSRTHRRSAPAFVSGAAQGSC
jgi:hypothetical protein